VFSELVIVIGSYALAHLLQDMSLYETLRKMNELKPFELVFLPEGPDSDQKRTRQELEGAIDSVTSDGYLDFLASPPTIRWVKFSPLWKGTATQLDSRGPDYFHIGSPSLQVPMKMNTLHYVAYRLVYYNPQCVRPLRICIFHSIG